jgi:ankyrin repeat protein
MGADVNAAATGGVTALHVAAEAGHDSIVSILLKVRGSLTRTLGKPSF